MSCLPRVCCIGYRCSNMSRLSCCHAHRSYSVDSPDLARCTGDLGQAGPNLVLLTLPHLSRACVSFSHSSVSRLLKLSIPELFSGPSGPCELDWRSHLGWADLGLLAFRCTHIPAASCCQFLSSPTSPVPPYYRRCPVCLVQSLWVEVWS